MALAAVIATWGSYSLIFGFLAIPLAPLVFSLLFLFAGGALGQIRGGYPLRGAVTLFIVLGIPASPGAYFAYDSWYEDRYEELLEAMQKDDVRPFLAQLNEPTSRWVVRKGLEKQFTCAGLASRPEVIDALVRLDSQGKNGYALCGIARYGSADAIRALLAMDFKPASAHRTSGEPCNPLQELVESSGASPGCRLMYGSYDQFVATPTAEGCAQRARVAEALIRAGARLPHTAGKKTACPELNRILAEATEH